MIIIQTVQVKVRLCRFPVHQRCWPSLWSRKHGLRSKTPSATWDPATRRNTGTRGSRACRVRHTHTKHTTFKNMYSLKDSHFLYPFPSHLPFPFLAVFLFPLHFLFSFFLFPFLFPVFFPFSSSSVSNFFHIFFYFSFFFSLFISLFPFLLPFSSSFFYLFSNFFSNFFFSLLIFLNICSFCLLLLVSFPCFLFSPLPSCFFLYLFLLISIFLLPFSFPCSSFPFFFSHVFYFPFPCFFHLFSYFLFLLPIILSSFPFSCFVYFFSFLTFSFSTLFFSISHFSSLFLPHSHFLFSFYLFFLSPVSSFPNPLFLISRFIYYYPIFLPLLPFLSFQELVSYLAQTTVRWRLWIWSATLPKSAVVDGSLHQRKSPTSQQSLRWKWKKRKPQVTLPACVYSSSLLLTVAFPCQAICDFRV